MEDDLQAGDDGCYCVAFRNTYGLKRQRLFQLLARFGRITRLAVSDNAGKRCFVRFSNPEDAVRAVSGLCANSRITDPSSVQYVNNVRDPPASTRPSPATSRSEAASHYHPQHHRGENASENGGVDTTSPMVRPYHRAESKDRSSDRGGRSASPVTVFMGNLPQDVQQADLHHLFEQHNISVLLIRLIVKPFKRFAFVEVENSQISRVARQKLDGYKLFGCVLRVVEAKSKPIQESLPGAMNGCKESNGSVDRSHPDIGHRSRSGVANTAQLDHWRSSSVSRSVRTAASRCMPPLILPGPEAAVQSTPRGPSVGERRSFQQRVTLNGESLFDCQPPSEKRVCVRGGPITSRLGHRPPQPRSVPSFDPDSFRPSREWRQLSPTPSDSGLSDRIKSRLHAPCEVVVANFPDGFSEIDILELFKPYNPMSVRIMVDRAGVHQDDFTYAYVTLSNRMGADQAVLELENRIVHQQPLVVEMKKC